jgi:4-amino-4-deoxy-L-arabinose transferase-like glycosyltransferase
MGLVVRLHATYAKLKAKTGGDNPAPWYTRWAWWLLAASLGVIVLVLWSMAKNREARNKAAFEVAEMKATQARLMALAERDQAKAAALLLQAAQADKRAKQLKETMAASAETRKQLEAAIKGASSWEELEEIEKELR